MTRRYKGDLGPIKEMFPGWDDHQINTIWIYLKKGWAVRKENNKTAILSFNETSLFIRDNGDIIPENQFVCEGCGCEIDTHKERRFGFNGWFFGHKSCYKAKEGSIIHKIACFFRFFFRANKRAEPPGNLEHIR